MIDRPTGTTIAEALPNGRSARANMLAALMSGEALTAGELAAHAGITAQTASGHLGKLTEGGLFAVERQGRHCYARLASPAVAKALEGLMALPGHTAAKPQRPRGARDAAMRLARSCYDHLAGRLGVAIADAMRRRDLVRLQDGVGLVRIRASASSPASASTSRDYLMASGCCAGRASTGGSAIRIWRASSAAILYRSVELGWLVRAPKGRTLRISRAGERGFAETFRCEPIWTEASALRLLDTAATAAGNDFHGPVGSLGSPRRPLDDRCNGKRRLME